MTGKSRGEEGEDGELRAIEQEASSVDLPADAHVIGEAVTVRRIHYTGNPRSGLLATCQASRGLYELSLSAVVFAPGSPGARLVARYRTWLGLLEQAPAPSPRASHKVTPGDIVTGEPVELIVIACKATALRCRPLGSSREVTLKTSVFREIPGAIITVTPVKSWTHRRHPYISGKVSAMRLDPAALDLVPLALHPKGIWDPASEYWGEEDEPLEEWVKPIIARGKRPRFEMEQLIPGVDPEEFDVDTDPILEASELNQMGDKHEARGILMSLLEQDIRCLDAHAHLGNFEFEHDPRAARLHYEMGVGIGELSLGPRFEGVLPWGLIDNRPFLRCLDGVGLCAWRAGEMETAAAVFRRMLWMNPTDNQGARFNLAEVEAGRPWPDEERN